MGRVGAGPRKLGSLIKKQERGKFTTGSQDERVETNQRIEIKS